MPDAPSGLVAAIRAGLARSAADIEVLNSIALPRNSGIRWELGDSDRFGPFGHAVDLGPALHEINLDLGALLPGLGETVGPSTVAVQAMPTSLQPLIVRYNPSAFTAAGLPQPSGAWTIDGFIEVCGAMDAAIRAGKLKSLGVDQVLYPLRDFTLQYGSWGQATLRLPLLWEAFIVGYGGRVHSGTKVAWDSGAALNGLSRLFFLFRQYGAALPISGPSCHAQGAAPPLPWMDPCAPSTMHARSAMEFIVAHQLPTPKADEKSDFAVAPFPRFPVSPIVPCEVGAMELLYVLTSPQGWPLPDSVPPSATTEAQAAARTSARYFQWRYADAQQALYADYGYAPITVSATGKSGFWKTYGIGAAGRRLYVAYPWPLAALQAFDKTLPTAWAQVLEDPTGVPAALSVLSTALTQGLEKAAAG